jgi:hypothetical protein
MGDEECILRNHLIHKELEAKPYILGSLQKNHIRKAQETLKSYYYSTSNPSSKFYKKE